MNTNPTEYAHPEALVDAAWLEQHLDDKDVRIVESMRISCFMIPATFPARSTSIGGRICRIR